MRAAGASMVLAGTLPRRATPPPPKQSQGGACLASMASWLGAISTVDDAMRALAGKGPAIMRGLRIRIGINTGGRPSCGNGAIRSCFEGVFWGTPASEVVWVQPLTPTGAHLLAPCPGPTRHPRGCICARRDRGRRVCRGEARASLVGAHAAARLWRGWGGIMARLLRLCPGDVSSRV